MPEDNGLGPEAGRIVSPVARSDEGGSAAEALFEFLDRLGHETAQSADPEAAMAITSRLTAEHLNVSNCAYADVDDDENGITIRGNWQAPGAPSIRSHYRLADFGATAVRELRAGRPVIINDNAEETEPHEARTLQEIGFAATICMPLIRNGRLRALMVVDDRLPRRWSAYERTVVREVTDRSWAHVERARAQAELVKSAQRFGAAGRATRGVLWTNDPDGRMTGEQPAWAKLTGQSYSEYQGYGWAQAVHPDDANATLEAWNRVVERREIFVFEHRVRRHDGEWRLCSIRAVPVTDPDGRVVEWVGVHTDITEERAAEQALRDGEAQLRLVLDASPGGFYAVDCEGTTTLVSRGFLDMMGFADESEAIGIKLHGMIHHSHADGSPYPVEECPIYRCAATGESAHVEEELFFRLDGRPVPVEYWATPIVLNGERIGASCTIVELTERKTAEAALREETRTLETLNRTGAALAAELDHERLVQMVTDAGVELTGAQFGAFFYNVLTDKGGSYMLYALSGAKRSQFDFGMPRATEIFRPTFAGEGVIRSSDITKDARYGKSEPHFGMPKGHLPVVSYLAVPVISRNGEVLGGLFFGHPEAGRFSERHERLILGIAAQAAVGIDNARLYQSAQKELADRMRAESELREAEAVVRTNEARLRFLDELGRATATATDADAVLATTTRLLGEYLKLSDCAYADMDDDEDMFNIRGDWHAAEMPSIVGRYSLATFGSLAVTNLRAGKPLVVNDNIKELGEDGSKAFLDIGIRATICMPFVKEGRLTALMAIHDAKPRYWTDDELNILNEVTERSWAHIERVRAEAELAQSESRLRLAIDGARIGTWDWDLVTARGTWSERTVEIMGVESGEDLAPDARFRSIHPDDLAWVQRAVVQSLQSGEEFSTEYRIVRPDGGIRWVSSRGIVQRDENGRPLRTTGTVRDVTERRQAQEALKALNETLEQQIGQRTAERDRMWRLSGDLFLVVGGRWEILSVNPALGPLLGYDSADIVGQRFSGFVHPDDLREVRGFIRAAASRPVRDFRARLRAKDGTWRHFAWSAAPGDHEAYVIGRDITVELQRREELDTAEEALRQAQKVESLGQVTGGVAHDFNNLLTPILGSLDLLRRNPGLGARDLRLLDGALESAERARTLVQRLLAFARRQPLKPGPVDLGGLIDGMASLIASTSGPQIAVVVDVAPNLPAALADANQLEMAILNLSVNSRDAMPSGGTLTLSAQAVEVSAADPSADLRAGPYLRLSVADTGFGMSEETMARAIEPFFSTKGIGKGTGLGLCMVHGLASQLGGEMKLSSKVGLGTTIDLYLPIASGAPALASPGDAAEAARGFGTILLVDDEIAVRTATKELLLDLGYSVIEVEDAASALKTLEGTRVEYLITDHLMPGMSGTDLARAVLEQDPDIRVLIISGYAELEAISPDLPRLAKPFRRDELLASLAALAR